MTLAFALLPLFLAADQTSYVSYQFEGNTLITPQVVFETGKATLAPESEAALNFVKEYLVAKTYVTMLRIEVHTDSQGDDAANQKLSEARAAAVVDALTQRGVSCSRLIAVGFGETKPVAPNTTAEGRAKNRRTVFVNAGLRGRAIGGMPIDGGGVAVKASSCQ